VAALGIVTDGRGIPRALVITTEVEVVPFDQVWVRGGVVLQGECL
jgi:uncharacterized protein YhfF